MYSFFTLCLYPILGLMISRCVVAQNGYINLTFLNATEFFNHLNVIYFNPTARVWSDTSYVESLCQNESVRIPPLKGPPIWINGGVWLQGVFQSNQYSSIFVVPSCLLDSSAREVSASHAYNLKSPDDKDSVWVNFSVCDSSASSECTNTNDVTTNPVFMSISSGKSAGSKGSSNRSLGCSTTSPSDHNAVLGNSDSSKTALIIICVLEAFIIVLVIMLTRKYWYSMILSVSLRAKGEDDNQNDINDVEIVTEHVNSSIAASTPNPIMGGGDNFHSNNGYSDVEEESSDAVIDYDYPQFEGHCGNTDDTDT